MKILLIGSPLVYGTIMTTACGQKFDPWNLSTWGNKEKSGIVNSFVNQVISDDAGEDYWSSDDWSYNFSTAFQEINSSAQFVNSPSQGFYQNLSWSYVNDKPDDALVKDVLKKGLLLSFKAISSRFAGEIMINFQGSVS